MEKLNLKCYRHKGKIRNKRKIPRKLKKKLKKRVVKSFRDFLIIGLVTAYKILPILKNLFTVNKPPQ